MSSVNLKIVRSDGAVFGDWSEQEPESNGWNIGCGKGWSIPNDGIGGAAELVYQVTTSENVLTDGSTLVSKRVGETERTIKLICTSRNADEERRNAIAFFNPKFSFELHIDYRGAQRYCVGEQTAFKADSGNIYEFPEITWTLLCLDPYMRGEDIHDETMTDARPMFTFPFRCFAKGPGVSSGCVPSFRVYDGLNTVVNRGGIPAPFRVTCRFDQAAKNPTFRVNDKHVSMVKTFKAGDVLTIDFMASPPRVEVNGVNSIQSCTRDSNFIGMVLGVGDNTFSYELVEGDINALSVSITYYERFMGV